jgi:acetyl-CoA acyltransferase
MKERVAIVAGIRSPFCKASGAFNDLEVDDLGAYVVKELLARSGIDPKQIDELILGNVIEPPGSANIARIIAVKAGLPVSMPAFTVNRNCASGMEAVVSAMNRITQGDAQIVIAGGAESMSGFPVTFSKSMRDFLVSLNKSKTWQQKLKTLMALRPSFFKPQSPTISDPLCDLSMGQTAENIIREMHIPREEQDKFALMSQVRAMNATKNGRLAEEIVPVPVPPKYKKVQMVDDGPRDNQTLEALAKLRPVFDKTNGTVTAGNSSQVTDGAAALLLMKESKAKELGFKPLGYITEYASAGLEPSRMGLGPAFAISKLLKKSGLNLKDIDLIEINEAFAGQVLAARKALASDEFAKKELGRDSAVGEIDLEKLNVNGGAVALGHPLGASGARLILTLLLELRKRNKRLGIASLCIGGGQGEAVLLSTPD